MRWPSSQQARALAHLALDLATPLFRRRCPIPPPGPIPPRNPPPPRAALPPRPDAPARQRREGPDQRQGGQGARDRDGHGEKRETGAAAAERAGAEFPPLAPGHGADVVAPDGRQQRDGTMPPHHRYARLADGTPGAGPRREPGQAAVA